jgi:hypothetical protein
MVRISRDKEIKMKHHHPWAQFVRESWVELPAGGSKFYMKPQCIVSGHQMIFVLGANARSTQYQCQSANPISMTADLRH